MNELEQKAYLLQKMDEFICNECSENTWWTWIALGVPDGNGTELEDFMWLAEEEDTFNDIVKLFKDLVSAKEFEEFLKSIDVFLDIAF